MRFRPYVPADRDAHDLDASTIARLRALLAAEPPVEGEGVSALVSRS